MDPRMDPAPFGCGERKLISHISNRNDICVLRIPGVYRFPIRTSLNSLSSRRVAYLETRGPRGPRGIDRFITEQRWVLRRGRGTNLSRPGSLLASSIPRTRLGDQAPGKRLGDTARSKRESHNRVEKSESRDIETVVALKLSMIKYRVHGTLNKDLTFSTLKKISVWIYHHAVSI